MSCPAKPRYLRLVGDMNSSSRLPGVSNLVLLNFFFGVVCLVCSSSCSKTIPTGIDEFSSKTYKRSTPIELIAYLQHQGGKHCPTIAVDNAPISWLQKKDVAALIPLLWSEQACANVHSVYSSFRDCRPSTVGREAAFLIHGFRQGKYPPMMNSGTARLDRQELEQWWNDNQKRQ